MGFKLDKAGILDYMSAHKVVVEKVEKMVSDFDTWYEVYNTLPLKGGKTALRKVHTKWKKDDINKKFLEFMNEYAHFFILDNMDKCQEFFIEVTQDKYKEYKFDSYKYILYKVIQNEYPNGVTMRVNLYSFKSKK